MNAVVIKSELDFLSFALDYLSSSSDSNDVPTLKFDGWPIISVHVEGDRYKGSLPSRLMEGLLAFQEETKRSYCISKYGTDNLQKLTHEDRIVIDEFVFTISNGCTQSDANGDDLLSRLCGSLETAFMRMTGKEIIATITIIAVCLGVTYVAKNYFDNQQQVALASEETKRLEASQKTAQDSVNAMQKTAQDSLETMRDVAVGLAMQNLNGKGELIVDRFANGYGEIVRSVPDAKSIEFGGVTLSNEEIKDFAKKDSVNKVSQEITSECFVSGYKENMKHLSLSVYSRELEQPLTIRADLNTLSSDDRDAILEAIKQKKSINLSFFATMSGDKVLIARLMSVNSKEAK
ncbi:hypothetical protein ACK33E_05720 [Aeromonas hydrophila]|uniref:hypothetical protein n=1 Tax=Aeromonas hydrophila TaxID=644 RepID=UPI00111BE22D|nr:hypothetical protein [Aeromonas hydrophila]